MKKQILSLILGAVVLATSPAFAMEDSDPQRVPVTKTPEKLVELEEAYKESEAWSNALAMEKVRIRGRHIVIASIGSTPELDDNFPQMRRDVQRTQEELAHQEITTCLNTSWKFGNTFMKDKMMSNLAEEFGSKQ